MHSTNRVLRLLSLLGRPVLLMHELLQSWPRASYARFITELLPQACMHAEAMA